MFYFQINTSNIIQDYKIIFFITKLVININII